MPPSEEREVRPRRKVARADVASELLPGQSIELLRELHLLTRDGELNADALRKLKQVNHLIRLLHPALIDLKERYAAPVVVDAGSGSSYLGFILYELYLKEMDRGILHSIDARPDLSERARSRAERLGFSRMEFQAADLGTASYPPRIHLLVALHACDTATDDAIAAGVNARADTIAVVPCCQAEVARQLKEGNAPGDPQLRALWEHPIHRREFGSHVTNVVRCLVLETLGYQVTATELTGWEHSLKSELLLARRVHRENAEARRRLDALLARVPVRPKLYGLLLGGAGAPELGTALP